ncbi:MAG: S-adenosylmethionine:tRNA ribosyltransferase-isomerase [Acidimicrobiia bacterium]
MRTDTLDFQLPIERLATCPREHRGEARHDSRLMVFHRRRNTIEFRWFWEIGNFLGPGDLVLLNDSKTLNASVHGRVEGTGRVEFQLRMKRGGLWYANCHPWKEPRMGAGVSFDGAAVTATVEGRHPKLPLWALRFSPDDGLDGFLEASGRPIPSPYVERSFTNADYNTVYATTPGSAEMPAAGRHFTPEVLSRLEDSGIGIAYITLHTGLSSVEIAEENLEDHAMHEEWFSIPAATADAVNSARAAGRTVLVVGTTVMRAVETAADPDGRLAPADGWTDLYIRPGYRFKMADALVTNFHGPRSSRIALAAAFTGQELLLRGYQQAIDEGLLFYEFGDATLTLPD